MSEPRRELAIPLPVRVERPEGGISTEYAVNLSPGGACLHLECRLAVGARVRLTFDLPPEGPHIEVLAAVVWSSDAAERPSGTRFFETGVRFEELPEAARQKLLAFASQPTDRRR
jgi:hypothetical protein